MKKVTFFFNYPKNEYYGGIANILSSYKEHYSEFISNGYEIDFLNPEISFSKIKIVSSFQKLLFLSKEKSLIKEYLKNNPEVEIIHIHSSRGWILYNDLKLASYIRSISNVRIFFSIHFADVDEILSHYKTYRKKEIKIINESIDKLIVLSKKTQKEFEILGIQKDKMSVLYTFHSFEKKDETVDDSKNNSLNLLFVGSLDYRKGIIDLVHALKKVDGSLSLDICGSYTNSQIKKEIKSAVLNDPRIVFHGYIKNREKEKLYRKADILILPSYAEGMPIVIMEALHFGCAIISTNIGAIPEIIRDGNGILISPGSIDELVNAIVFYMNNPNELFDTKTNNLVLSEQFSINENIMQLCRIYGGDYGHK